MVSLKDTVLFALFGLCKVALSSPVAASGTDQIVSINAILFILPFIANNNFIE